MFSSLLFSTRLFNHLPRYTDTEVVPMLLSYQSNQLDRIPEGEMGERGVGKGCGRERGKGVGGVCGRDVGERGVENEHETKLH